MADFKAAAWNVYFGTPLEELEPVLAGLVADDVTVYLIQEASQRGFMGMLKDHGLDGVHIGPQWVVAWHPSAWVEVNFSRVRLADTHWTTQKGHAMWSDSASAILSDLEGRTLTALSYHLPSHVQVKDAPARRLQAHRESLATLTALARGAKTHAVLFGGDDNVDEGHGRGVWDYALRATTGLRQIKSPDADSRGGRHIIDFRVKGLRAGEGSTRPGGGDHKVHVREFFWRR